MVYIVKDREVISIIGVNDIIRENVKEVIEIFDKKKIKTIMLTGDNEKTAAAIAKKIFFIKGNS